ncbi:MAG: NADH-quinone oxidoreductase subunit M [Planctomycetota bacterium]
MGSNLLSLTFLLPLAGSVLVLLVPKESAVRACRWVNLLATLATFVATLAVWSGWNAAKAKLLPGQYALTEDVEWIAAFGIRYHLGVDGVSVALLLLTSFVSIGASMASWNIEKSAKGYHSMFLLLLAGMVGVFMALDLFLFYLFWEIMLLPMYFLIGIWGGPRRQYASIKFFLYTLAGSVLMLAGIVLIWIHHRTFQIPEIVQIAQSTGLFEGKVDGAATYRLLCFIGFFVAFAIKVPLFPFHTWLPDAHVEAPTPISMILAGVLLKMGGYGLIRMAYPFFPAAAVTLQYWIVGLSLASIVYGALVAMAQTDFKKLVAYSSVSHMGFVTLGLASLTPEGSNGAMYMMLAHGTISPMLFMLVGVIYERAHHRDIDRFGGLAWAMPRYGVLAAFGIFASLGLPGLSGFIAEITVFLGSFDRFPRLTLVATLGMVVTAAYYLITLQKVYLGDTPAVYQDKAHYPDVSKRELWILLPLAAVTLLMGVLPGLAMEIYRVDLEGIVKGVKEVGDAIAKVK